MSPAPFGSFRRASSFVRLALLVLLLAAAPLASLQPAGAQPNPILPTNFVDDTLVMGLEEPNSMAFLPDGRLLFTEKGTGYTTGKIRMIVGSHIASTDPVGTVDSLVSDGERGLQGIAVDPRWPTFPYVYVGYTHSGNHTWLIRLTATGEVNDPIGENLSLGTPLVLINDIRDNFENHNGLGLRFDPDGYLHFSLGEDSDRCSAQAVDTLRGKMLRLAVTGLPAGGGGPVPRALLTPPDNPFVASPDSNARLVYALGLRNPWRFDIDPVEGTIVAADVGENEYEELNEILPGRNYGWPFCEGPAIKEPVGCTEPGGPGGSSYEPPILTWDNGIPSVAIRTCGFYRPVSGGANNWPSMYWGDLFYGDYYTCRLRRLHKSGGSWVVPPPAPGQPNADDFSLAMFWNADFVVGPDGSLYWLKAWDNSYNPSSGMLRRIRWAGPPVSVEGPRPARSLTAWPNPFAARTSIAFRVARAGEARLVVVDAAGRQVRELTVAGAAGDVRVTWDGTDERGRAVAPGIYLVRVAGEGLSEALRVLRLR